jgi:hypothetical protein
MSNAEPDQAQQVPAPPEPPPQPDEVVGAAFTRYINTKWRGSVICPVCKTDKWTSQASVNAPLRYSPGRAYVFIPVTCDNCKYAMLFNASAAGLFDLGGNPIPAPTESSPESPGEPEGGGES